MAKKTFGNYYLGLDIGTDSVGWAVTDENYEILKFNGKAMWGSYLFREGKTAEERRLHRCSRRRLERRGKRIDLLRELFDQEISSVDPGFFARLDESNLVVKDRKCKQPNSVFNDPAFKDKDLHDKYPTIYHLRSDMIHTKVKPDIRLVYLALHHIVKYRGHFLYEGLSNDAVPEFDVVFRDTINRASADYGMDFDVEENIPEIQNTLADRNLTTTDKKNKLAELLGCHTKSQKAFAHLLAGAKVKMTDLFEDLSDDETVKELDGITFKGTAFDEKADDIKNAIGEERFPLLEEMKNLYDWGILTSLLKGQKYISDAKIEDYEQHKKDLAILKAAVKSMSPEGSRSALYRSIFKSEEKNNYACYSKNVKSLNGSQVEKAKFNVSQEDFCKYVLDKLEGFDFSKDKYSLDMKNRLDNRTFMPKQTSKDNSVLPNSIHMMELKAILENVSVYYPFLDEKDSDGISIRDKIESICSFRMPYYVGPVNQLSNNCWAVRRAEGKVLPWNWEKVIDIDKTSENFIKRLISRCSYLPDEKVIPKSSLLYGRFMLHNELNNISVNGARIDPQMKNNIVKELFEGHNSVVTKTKLEKHISSITGVKDVTITGIDDRVKASLSSENKLREILGDLAGKHKLAEQLVETITIYGDDRKRLKQKLNADYRDKLSKEQISKLSSLKFSDWGRLSEKFLTGIVHEFPMEGSMNIINALETTNMNLMELLSDRFTYSRQIESINRKRDSGTEEITLEDIDELYCSPAVKHSIWCVMSVIKDIIKVTGHYPKKTFIETTREEGEKVRKESRKKGLVDLYKACQSSESMELLRSIESTDEPRFRGKKLYAYYLQMGRCAYCGRPIDLNDLGNNDVCDMDHIYPQSKCTDDSIHNNMVLACRTCNMDKGNSFPIRQEIQEKMGSFWSMLHSQGLMSPEKYKRLTRKDGFSDDELSRFISRQLVETSQSVKAVATILKRKFGDESDIVYVKGGNVSKFRNEIHDHTEMEHAYYIKCRNINDLHHAKDAYLNIVVGNVYDVKFTKNPTNFIQTGEGYNLNNVFKYDVTRGNETAWKKGADGTISVVDKWMRRNNILYTRKPYKETGQISDLQILKKGTGQLPIKNGMDIDTYGGYSDVTGSYFSLVEHTEKKKTIRSFESVPVYIASKLEEADIKSYNEYFTSKGLVNAKTIIPCIRKGSFIEKDGFELTIAGRSGNKIVYNCGRQLILPYFEKEINVCYKFKSLYKFTEALKNKGDKPSTIDYGLDDISLSTMYTLLIEKLKRHYCKVKFLDTQLKALEGIKSKFESADAYNKAVALDNILHLFTCDAMTMDLKAIGGGASGRISYSKNISNKNTFILIDKSPTGLFEYRRNLNEI